MSALSASFNCRLEDVRVLTIIVAELEFSDIQRHVFGAHLVKRAHHAALEDRPEALNRLGMNRADDVLALGVVNGRVRIFLVEFFVALPLIGAEQANFVRNGFAHEVTERIGADVLANARDHVALALDRSNDGNLARTNAASPAALAALVLGLVVLQPAAESFITLDNAA